MANNNQIAFALGMAQKAGKTASGDFSVKSTLKGGKAKLLVVAADAAPNSKKDLLYIAQMAKVPVIEALTGAELGYAIGKAKRVAVAITDVNFANMLLKK